MSDEARLSKMLFEAREVAEMYADVVKSQTGGREDTWSSRLVAEIDAYRVEHGWNPHGFGGEGES